MRTMYAHLDTASLTHWRESCSHIIRANRAGQWVKFRFSRKGHPADGHTVEICNNFGYNELTEEFQFAVRCVPNPFNVGEITAWESELSIIPSEVDASLALARANGG